MDRYKLKYLNQVERINCSYCSYFNGVIAYVREVASRTEQYWCPIGHSKMIEGYHSRYHEFIDYGDAVDYHIRLNRLREELREL